MLLSERSQPEMAADCTVPMGWHYGKNKAKEAIKKMKVAQEEQVEHGAVKLCFVDTIMMGTHHYMFVQTSRMYTIESEP